MTQEQAEQAIVRPLDALVPPLAYDLDFLHTTLLPDLATEQAQETIHPTHLQIVCHELYQSARRTGTAVIGDALYPKGGVQTFLSRYLRETLNRCCSEPGMHDLARKLLKQMVSPSGERVFVATDELARTAEVELSRAESALGALAAQGLLESRSAPGEPALYSVSQNVVAAQVRRWFDRDETLAQCAQEALNRAWADWYAGWYSVQRDTSGNGEEVRTLLVGRDRLYEIRRWRHRLSITSPQFCLLLHSAVQHRLDITYWAHQLAQDAKVQLVLHQVQYGVSETKAEQVNQAAEALGLPQGDVGSLALSRAGFGHADPVVRHTAALALAALGLDEVHQALARWKTTATNGQRWPPAQPLAQMTVARFPLPQLPIWLIAQVHAWATGMRLYTDRWRLIWQMTGASWGGGLSLMLTTSLALIPFPSGVTKRAEIVAGLVVGIVVGAAFAAGRWLVGMQRTRPIMRVLGGAAGFGGALVFLFTMARMEGWQLLAGPLVGAIIALGWELVQVAQRPRPWRAALGGGLGGIVGFMAAGLLRMGLPFVPQASVFNQAWGLGPHGQWVGEYLVPVLFGAAMGAGLTGGAMAGEAVRNRFVRQKRKRDQTSTPTDDR
jgi:hypothetical protein